MTCDKGQTEVDSALISFPALLRPVFPALCLFPVCVSCAVTGEGSWSAGEGGGESVAETDEIPSSGINERFLRAVSELRMCWTWGFISAVTVGFSSSLSSACLHEVLVEACPVPPVMPSLRSCCPSVAGDGSEISWAI